LWVMGKEKSDTPHKRAGNVHGAIMDRRTRHMTTVQRGLGRGTTPKKFLFEEATIRRNGSGALWVTGMRYGYCTVLYYGASVHHLHYLTL
jgi:hypothetical protein